VQSDLLIALQVAVIIIAAKFLGRFFERRLGQPSVIGEVVAGLIIGPFALGGIAIASTQLHLPLLGQVVTPAIGPLFPTDSSGFFHEGLLRVLTILGAVVLLFDAGLETNLKRFLAFAPAGLATGLGGSVLSFFLGAGAAVWSGLASSLLDPVAMVLGVIATATSVGLTVRVLSDTRRLNTPEGATILSAAVIDDVIALVFLSLVVSMNGDSSGATIPWGTIGLKSLKASVVFFGLLGIGLLFRRKISTLLLRLGSLEAAGVVALTFGLLAACIAEASGLALIVGAYVMGLSLSETDIVFVIHKALIPVKEFFVPLLFCVTGMLANLAGVGSLLPFAILYTILISLGKIVGCGLPAIPFGFNLRGAARIGVGMVPRQEVGLIVAGIAFVNGLIGSQMMGAVVVMILATAIATPPLLAVLFRSGSGLRRPARDQVSNTQRIRIPLPAHDFALFFAEQMVEMFHSEGFHVFDLPVTSKVWDLRKGSKVVTVAVEEGNILIMAEGDSLDYARLVFLETITVIKKVVENFDSLGECSIRHLLFGKEDPRTKEHDC
jgi:Kef-type K+ transport system membrane component KefB